MPHDTSDCPVCAMPNPLIADECPHCFSVDPQRSRAVHAMGNAVRLIREGSTPERALELAWLEMQPTT